MCFQNVAFLSLSSYPPISESSKVVYDPVYMVFILALHESLFIFFFKSLTPLRCLVVQSYNLFGYQVNEMVPDGLYCTLCERGFT